MKLRISKEGACAAMKCPKCGAEMKSIGPWPDYADAEKIKETFICEACHEPDKPYETVRVEPKL